MEYKQHEIQWTPQKIANFWKFYHNFKSYEESFFTKQVGSGIINFVRDYIKLAGNILDYGAGHGFLIERLINNDCGWIWGCDFSADSVNKVNAKFKDCPRFKGCILLGSDPSILQSEFYNTVFLVETIEHLTDEFLKDVILEIKKVLVSNGTLIITTPNNQDLDLDKVNCPDCGAIFHRLQHVRSFNRTSLSDLMKHFGFSKMLCVEENLNWYNHKNLINSVKILSKGFRQSRLPHLIYVGRKGI